jgi:nucleotide-binding universal stress UspA family protein
MADLDTSATLDPFPVGARRGPVKSAVRPHENGTSDANVSAVHPAEIMGRERRILVCLDRSRSSEVCIPHAVFLAKTFGSAITLVHVMPARHGQAGPQSNDALGWEISRQEAQGYLERIEKQTSTALGRPVDVRLEQGRPAERIVDVAHDLGAYLSVLASRGDGGGSALTLGSTVQQVLALARGSVFIAHTSSSVPAVIAPKRILVPLDGSLRTESVLPTAARIAAAHGAELLLVHIVQEPLPTGLLRAADDMDFARKLAQRLESGARRYLAELQEQLAHEVASVRTLVVRHSNEYQCILEISQKEETDLVILSAHGSGCDSTQSFGSVTGYLLTHSMVPLLVLQDLPSSDLHPIQQVDGRTTPPSLRASYAPGGV